MPVVTGLGMGIIANHVSINQLNRLKEMLRWAWVLGLHFKYWCMFIIFQIRGHILSSTIFWLDLHIFSFSSLPPASLGLCLEQLTIGVYHFLLLLPFPIYKELRIVFIKLVVRLESRVLRWSLWLKQIFIGSTTVDHIGRPAFHFWIIIVDLCFCLPAFDIDLPSLALCILPACFPLFYSLFVHPSGQFWACYDFILLLCYFPKPGLGVDSLWHLMVFLLYFYLLFECHSPNWIGKNDSNEDGVTKQRLCMRALFIWNKACQFSC